MFAIVQLFSYTFNEHSHPLSEGRKNVSEFRQDKNCFPTNAQP